MMVQQVEITLKTKSRGFHLVTSEIMSQLPKPPKTGIVRSTSGRLLPKGRKNIFCKHTSCGLSINENVDPDVRLDMETIFNRLVPENRPEYEHTLEGADDMPAHAKSTLSGVSLTIPITNGHLNMGTWQGIYFCGKLWRWHINFCPGWKGYFTSQGEERKAELRAKYNFQKY